MGAKHHGQPRCLELRLMLPTLCPATPAPAHPRVQSAIPASLGCGLLYVTNQQGNLRRTRLARGPGVPRANTGGGSGVAAAAAGDFGTGQYAVLG